MTDFLKSIYRGNVIYAICLIVMGLVFAFWPASSRELLVRIIGALLVLSGAALIFLFFRNRAAGGPPVSLIGGVIDAVLGVLIFAKPAVFVDFVIIVAGVFIGLSGILNFCQTLSLAMTRFRLWWVAMIMSILTIVFSVLVISKPGAIADVIFIVAGIFMVIDGITDLWIARNVHSTARTVRNTAHMVQDEIEAAALTNDQVD